MIHGDACALPFPDHSIDLVLTSPPSDMLRTNRKLAFAEIARVAKHRVILMANVPGQKIVEGYDYPASPEGYIRALIGLNSVIGDRVLDCFAGTGIIEKVANRMGRYGISLELDDAIIEKELARG